MGLMLDSVRPLTGKYAKQVVMLSVMQTDEINVSSDDNTMSLSDRQFCHRLLKSPFRQRRLRTSATHLEHNPFFFQALQPGSDTYSEPCHTPCKTVWGRQTTAAVICTHAWIAWPKQPGQPVLAWLQCKRLG